MLRRSFESVSTMLSRKLHQGSSEVGDLFASEARADSEAFEVYRCDGGDEISPPHVIIAEASAAEELFATIATYHPASSPVTAFSHVTDESDRGLLRGSGKASRRKAGTDFVALISALLGASIGEAALQSSRSSESTFTYSACRRSLSFSLARSVSVYRNGDRLELISDRWTSLRRMSSLSVPRHLSDALLMLCGLFEGIDPSGELDISEKNEPMLFLAGVLSGDAKSSAKFRHALEARFPGLDPYFLGLKGSFDGRLSAFTEIVSIVANSSENQALKDVSVAYVCDQILPGSFSHSGVLQKLVERFPAALVWYGAFAAASYGPNQHKAQPVLDKLRRDCGEEFSFESRPQCDVSFAELEVVSRVGLRSDALRPSQSKVLSVALVPGVNVYAEQPGQRDSSNESMTGPRQTVAAQEAIRLLEQAARLLSEEGARPSSSDSRFRKRKGV